MRGVSRSRQGELILVSVTYKHPVKFCAQSLTRVGDKIQEHSGQRNWTS